MKAIIKVVKPLNNNKKKLNHVLTIKKGSSDEASNKTR